ncbi:IclR family transcriptional regulator [Streptomyces sp. CB01881]|nr:IclR family transcriptional regulator [Streptomyces sp. CB01881]TYC70896.1 IclR family transcriptional regulator [Streptomyces sp. CB01881]
MTEPATAATAAEEAATDSATTRVTATGAATAAGPDAPAPAGRGAEPAELVGPLVRGLTVLRAMAADPAPRQRPGDLARATGLARSTIDRVATTLVRLGHLRAEDRDLVLAPGLARLGNAYLSSCGLPEALGPHAVALADELDESVSVAVPDGAGARFVHQATRRRAMAISFRIGDLLPAERCAPGAVFAAGWTADQWAGWRDRHRADPLDTGFPALPPRPGGPATGGGAATGGAATGGAAAGGAAADLVEERFRERALAARADGWATDDQLIEPGLVAIAAPVHGPAGAVVCAVSVVSHTSRHDADSLARHALPRLRATARAMEHALAAGGARTAGGAHHDGERQDGGRHDSGGRDSGRHDSGRYDSGRYDSGPKEELGAEFLQSLARGLDVLRALGQAGPGGTLAEVARATGLPRATARRSLLTLRHLGYVRADDTRFALLPRVLELGYARLAGLSFAELALPHLVDLVKDVHESASAAVLDGDDIRYVARVPTSRIMRIELGVGTRLPAWATSMGRVLLAALPPERREALLDRAEPQPLTPHTVTDRAALAGLLATAGRDGYALVDEELEEGLRSLAVPVRDGRGGVAAAVNVALHAGRGTAGQSRAAILPRLAEAAARIEADLAEVTRWSPAGRA